MFSSGCLVGTENSLTDLADKRKVFSIVYGSDVDTASPVFAWRIIRAIELDKTSFVA